MAPHYLTLHNFTEIQIESWCELISPFLLRVRIITVLLTECSESCHNIKYKYRLRGTFLPETSPNRRTPYLLTVSGTAGKEERWTTRSGRWLANRSRTTPIKNIQIISGSSLPLTFLSSGSHDTCLVRKGGVVARQRNHGIWFGG